MNIVLRDMLYVGSHVGCLGHGEAAAAPAMEAKASAGWARGAVIELDGAGGEPGGGLTSTKTAVVSNIVSGIVGSTVRASEMEGLRIQDGKRFDK